MERDAHKRIVGYTPEPEWDDTEREWMRALADYEASLCPECGLPLDECHDPMAPYRFAAEVSVCEVGAMRRAAVDQWTREHDAEQEIRKQSLTTSVRRR